MRVLVTGHSGVVGRAVFAAFRTRLGPGDLLFGLSRAGAIPLCKDGPATAGLSADLTDPTAAATAVRLTDPTHVVHCAGLAVNGDPVEVLRQDYGATRNLVQALLTHAPSARLVYASSAAVFGAFPGDGPTEADPPRPSSVYGWAKLAGEDAVGLVRGSLSVRLVAQVGPGMSHGLVRDVVRKLRSPADTLELLGDPPGSDKPYCRAGHTGAVVADLALGDRTGVAHLSPPDGLTVEAIAGVVMDVLGVRKPIRWLGETANFVGDHRRVRLRPTPPGPTCPPSADAVRRGVEDIIRESE